MHCIVSPSTEASWEICSMAIFIFSRLPEATWFAQVSSKWIKYRPRSSDFSSLSHGYGDPKLGEGDIMENNWRGEEVTDKDLSSIGAINTNGEMVIAINEIKKNGLNKPKEWISNSPNQEPNQN